MPSKLNGSLDCGTLRMGEGKCATGDITALPAQSFAANETFFGKTQAPICNRGLLNPVLALLFVEPTTEIFAKIFHVARTLGSPHA